MVNNAGVGGSENQGSVHEMTEESWDNVMETNSRSVFLGCKYACAQFMGQAPHATGHRGWIINTSSIYGLVGQAAHGGQSVKRYCLDYTVANFVACSCLLRIKRSRHPSHEAGRC